MNLGLIIMKQCFNLDWLAIIKKIWTHINQKGMTIWILHISVNYNWNGYFAFIVHPIVHVFAYFIPLNFIWTAMNNFSLKWPRGILSSKALTAFERLFRPVWWKIPPCTGIEMICRKALIYDLLNHVAYAAIYNVAIHDNTPDQLVNHPISLITVKLFITSAMVLKSMFIITIIDFK